MSIITLEKTDSIDSNKVIIGVTIRGDNLTIDYDGIINGKRDLQETRHFHPGTLILTTHEKDPMMGTLFTLREVISDTKLDGNSARRSYNTGLKQIKETRDFSEIEKCIVGHFLSSNIITEEETEKLRKGTGSYPKTIENCHTRIKRTDAKVRQTARDTERTNEWYKNETASLKSQIEKMQATIDTLGTEKADLLKSPAPTTSPVTTVSEPATPTEMTGDEIVELLKNGVFHKEETSKDVPFSEIMNEFQTCSDNIEARFTCKEIMSESITITQADISTCKDLEKLGENFIIIDSSHLTGLNKEDLLNNGFQNYNHIDYTFFIDGDITRTMNVLLFLQAEDYITSSDSDIKRVIDLTTRISKINTKKRYKAIEKKLEQANKRLDNRPEPAIPTEDTMTHGEVIDNLDSNNFGNDVEHVRTQLAAVSRPDLVTIEGNVLKINSTHMIPHYRNRLVKFGFDCMDNEHAKFTITSNKTRALSLIEFLIAAGYCKSMGSPIIEKIEEISMALHLENPLSKENARLKKLVKSQQKEVIYDSLVEGCTSLQHITDYLNNHGFTVTKHNVGAAMSRGVLKGLWRRVVRGEYTTW